MLGCPVSFLKNPGTLQDLRMGKTVLVDGFDMGIDTIWLFNIAMENHHF